MNEYFTSGLAESLVDKWFTGPVPYFTPLDIGAAPSDQRDLDEVLARAMATAKDPKAMQWRSVCHRLMNILVIPNLRH